MIIQKKPAVAKQLPAHKAYKLFLSSDSASRACRLAGTAVDALRLINYILGIALGNALYRTYRCARTTADALVRNKMCHNETSWKINIINFVFK